MRSLRRPILGTSDVIHKYQVLSAELDFYLDGPSKKTLKDTSCNWKDNNAGGRNAIVQVSNNREGSQIVWGGATRLVRAWKKRAKGRE